VVYIVTTEL